VYKNIVSYKKTNIVGEMDINLKMMLVNYFFALSILLFLLIQRRMQNKRSATSHKKTEKEMLIMFDSPDDDKFLSSIFSEIRASIAVTDNTNEHSAIKKTYLRLIKDNISEKKAIDSIASVVISEMYFSLKCKKYELFKDRFHENLDKLPEIPILK